MDSLSASDIFLGVDVGSGSSRAALITATGKLLAIHSTPHSISRPAPDYFEQSSDEIWSAICTSVKAALAIAHVDPVAVKGIGFDATCSLVAYTSGMPEFARPVSISPSSDFQDHNRNIIMWCDHRAKDQAVRITKTRHEILKNIGGTMSLEMELPKTLWLQENMPKEKWRNIGRLFDLPDFLTWKATGDYFPSRCSVVCKWCYKAGPESLADGRDGSKDRKQGWPADFLRQIGLGEIADEDCQKLCGIGNPEQRVHFAGEHIGGLTEKAAEELGLVPGIAVGGAVIDAYAGAIGTLGAKLNGKQPTVDEASKRISMICGTSSCHLAMSNKPIFVNGVWGPFHGVMLPDMWVAEGGQSSTGQLIDYLTKSHPAYSEALKRSQSATPPMSIYEFLNEHLEVIREKQGVSNIAYLTKHFHITPDHHGNRSPFADETIRGSISGLDLNNNNVDGLAVLYLAAIQALAIGTRQIVDALCNSGYTIETICISGGLSLNRVFVRVLADVMQLPVVMPGSGGDAAVVVGAAICGAVAYESKAKGPDASMDGMLWRAMARLTEASDVVEPAHDSELKQFYQKKQRVVERMQQDQREYNKIMSPMADKETHAKEIITIESSDEDGPSASSSSSNRPPDTPGHISSLTQGSESATLIGAKRIASSSPESSIKKSRQTPSLQYLESSVHLTSVERAQPFHNIDCFSLESLIGDPDIELMVQINFMIDVDFVMKRVHESIRDGLRTIVYHGLRMTADQALSMNTQIYKQYPRVDMRRVQVSGIGTHHTKAMILFYTNNTMQLIVHTANMIPRDWRNKTQALFTTGRLQTKAMSMGSPSTCAFERDLLEYLRHYENHQEIVSRVAQYDFQSVKGVLVASVPGRFSGPDKNKWGHLKLRSVLRLQTEIPREFVTGSQIICQISSIGSLGKSSQDWLRGEFETSLNAHRNANYLPQNKGDLCVVFPTAEDVRTSHEGWSMGGSIPFKSTSYNKQAQYLNPILHSWVATKSGRDRAMPHVKTYTRVSRRADGDYVSWFLLTSSNLSKPAWGELKDGALVIKSFELGVLIFPGLFESSNVDSGTEAGGEALHVFMMNATVDNPYPEPSLVPYAQPQATDMNRNELDKRDQLNVGVVPVRLPFDLPLRKYNFERDQVWLIDKAFPGVDDFGELCRP